MHEMTGGWYFRHRFPLHVSWRTGETRREVVRRSAWRESAEMEFTGYSERLAGGMGAGVRRRDALGMRL